MSETPSHRGGATRWKLRDTEVLLDPSGAMFVPSASLLVVSDLHFEKGSHYAAAGQFLPPYDTRTTLKSVGAAIAAYRPKTVLSLGDTFHDVSAERRMTPEDHRALRARCTACEWIFVLGNHDPLPPEAFRGEAMDHITIAGLTFTHEPEGQAWNVAGHLHPCAVATREGRRLRRSCFISDGTRMILPSMGAFTGGL
ncbi:MAG: ligase-associated DNA damage response endonuclease PdeM, partial [Pseudomonadota bacterium]